jgi:hypothetical protein
MEGYSGLSVDTQIVATDAADSYLPVIVVIIEKQTWDLIANAKNTLNAKFV